MSAFGGSTEGCLKASLLSGFQNIRVSVPGVRTTAFGLNALEFRVWGSLNPEPGLGLQLAEP